MKNIGKLILSVLLVVFSTNVLLAFDHNQDKGKKDGGKDPVGNKAGCAPATSRLTMSFNDVKALIEPGGLLWLDRANGVAGYEVPKASGATPNPTSIYSGALWMGGTDINGQLKLAAQLFRRGVDFWTGPLSATANQGNYNPNQPVGDNVTRNSGEATINPNQCLSFDKFFTIRKAEVVLFNLWWECKNINPNGDGCDETEISNELLNRINNWPAHGDVSLGQDYYLAPFYDNPKGPNGVDGIYNPADGDHPWYDDILGRDDIACGSDRRISLFGDETNWWVFNDKGNIHTETNGDPIGMEIRAQAFSFTTDDEVNRMTFYNYEMINRGTQTLKDTYFAQFVDTDLGGYSDDYVGCDVSRGLGYCFNGDNYDDPQNGRPGFGNNPPAIGVDFFEGPYQDADGIDNPGPRYVTDANGVTTYEVPTVVEAIAQKGIVYSGLGIGYGDGIIDNERFGMKGFTYFSGQGAANANQSDPSTAAQFYNYMTGKWKNGSLLYYGGTGFEGSTGITTIPSRYMFPDDSDSLNWGTEGVDPGFNWSEVTSNNPAGDRRFVQAAGPFTLKPGAVNNITVGVVYARSFEGDLFASVRSLKRADTKAQALFDNCFKIFDPPQAPRLTIQELENQLVLVLDNPKTSNNYQEKYREEDKINIVDPGNGTIYDKFYNFEGYQIFQLVDDKASVADIGDVTKARLVAQCDKKNDISRLINFEFDEDLGFSIPVEKVDGENKGIKHSFIVKEDQFAQGSRTLVNHKTYYYIAIAYAYNNYKTYNPNDANLLDGQKRPYYSSRNGYDGNTVTPVATVPHNPKVQNNGTTFTMQYGDSPELTRLDGVGNGNRALDLVQSSVDEIVKKGIVDNLTYKKGAGPINVKVVDPLNVISGHFECKFLYDTIDIAKQGANVINKGSDTARWIVYRYNNATDKVLLDSITSEQSIVVANEQIIPEWGISIEISQSQYYFVGAAGAQHLRYTPPIESTIEFKDSSKRWLTFIPDNDGFSPQNWIMSGDYVSKAAECAPEDPTTNPCFYNDEKGRDNSDKRYAKLLNGGIAPHALTRYRSAALPLDFMPLVYPSGVNITTVRNRASISRMPNVDIVITSDTSKWTRCAVIEMGSNTSLNIGQVEAGKLRGSASVDKQGRSLNDNTKGMGWFPGYAIDIETGMRLHMAFGENSFLGADNGSDMIWNPSDRLYNNVGNYIFGGQHPIYVFGYNLNGDTDPLKACPYYDGVNNWVYDRYLAGNFSDLFSNLAWVVNPILSFGKEYLATDVKLRVRINKEYNDYNATGLNKGRPMYSWNLNGSSTVVANKEALKEALDIINVVPNPYYAFSEYEKSRLDTRVKITNLPEQCTVKIYNISGKLIRTFKKDSPVTSLDWDMKNNKGIPIASGVYLIHVEVPGIGDKVVKFFGGVRQIDLENI